MERPPPHLPQATAHFLVFNILTCNHFFHTNIRNIFASDKCFGLNEIVHRRLNGGVLHVTSPTLYMCSWCTWML